MSRRSREVSIAQQCLKYGSAAVLQAIADITARREVLEEAGVPASISEQCQSDAELEFLLHAYHELPGLVPQFKVDGYRADFALPDKGILIEIDGRTYHEGPKAFVHDRRRDRRLGGGGWRIMRFAAQEVYQDATACVAEIAALPEPLPFDDLEGLANATA